MFVLPVVAADTELFVVPLFDAEDAVELFVELCAVFDGVVEA